jgi:propanediol utilization protein
VKRKSSDAHKVTPKKKYENLFGQNNNILVRKDLENQCPGKAAANLAPTPVPSPDQKIKKLAIWYKTFLL